MELLMGLDGLLVLGLVYGHLWWVVLSSLVEDLRGVALEVGVFTFRMTFSCFGGCGGPVMSCGPEIMELLCV